MPSSGMQQKMLNSSNITHQRSLKADAHEAKKGSDWRVLEGMHLALYMTGNPANLAVTPVLHWASGIHCNSDVEYLPKAIGIDRSLAL